MKFVVQDALGRTQAIEAKGWDEAVKGVLRTGRRNVYGIESRRGKVKFYLDRGGAVLWPIGVSAALVELNMGGFQ